jgi:hypothetical protein
MEALSVTEQASQSKENFATQIKNLSSLVGKLSSSIEDNVVERRTERQISSSPVTGYTPGIRERPFNLKGGLWFFSKKIF